MIISKNEPQDIQATLDPKGYIIDIETTGFSARYASIYMLGLLYIQDGRCISEQWLCEKDSDEYELLYKFNQLLEDKKILYHYNGDQFDMPFIKKRMALYNLKCHPYESIDLIKLVRPYKKRLGLDNLKLKTIEAYFGYHRDDPFSGGDLIEVYKAYTLSHDKQSLDVLLLHNYEDLLGLMEVLDHLPLFDLLDKFKNRNQPIDLFYSTMDNGIYCGRFKVPDTVTSKLIHPLFSVTIAGGILEILVPVLVDHLRFYFPDPQNYYYLAEGDYAIHKSVGQFVAKSHRVQATRANAYIKKEGFFLPAHHRYALPYPLYFKEGSQKEAYVSIEDLVEMNGFETYISMLLSQL